MAEERQAACGYQPSFFAHQEKEVTCSSAQNFIHHCRSTWDRVCSVLRRSADRYSTATNKHGKLSSYLHLWWVKVSGSPPVTCLSRERTTSWLPLSLGHLRSLHSSTWRRSICMINPMFYVSRIKPVQESHLMPPFSPPPPSRLINGGPGYAIKRLLQSR